MFEILRPQLDPKPIARFFLTLLLGLVNITAVADTIPDSDKVRNHVIIAVDNVVPLYEDVLCNKSYMLSQMDKILRQDGDKLLSDGDYVSVVTFGLGAQNYNFDRFVLPATLKGEPLVWRDFTSWGEIFPNWSGQVLNKAEGRMIGAPYSMLSGAKPFIMSTVKSPDADKAAERTYMLMITDDHYNGNDNYRKEFADYRITGGCAPVEPFERQVNQYHSFFKEREVARTAISTSRALPYYLILLEIVPANIPSLNGIVDIPASLNIHRVPGGYGIGFKAKSVDDFYKFRNLKVTVNAPSGESLVGESDSEGNVDMVIPYGAVDPSDIRVDIDGEVLQKDGMYDGMLMSPGNANTPRMHTSRSISVQEDGKIFGAPMPDVMWWWARDDVKMAAFVWEVIIVLLVILLTIAAVGYYNKKSTVYTLGNDEIGIRAITSGHNVGSKGDINLKKNTKNRKKQKQ